MNLSQVLLGFGLESNDLEEQSQVVAVDMGRVEYAFNSGAYEPIHRYFHFDKIVTHLVGDISAPYEVLDAVYGSFEEEMEDTQGKNGLTPLQDQVIHDTFLRLIQDITKELYSSNCPKDKPLYAVAIIGSSAYAIFHENTHYPVHSDRLQRSVR